MGKLTISMAIFNGYVSLPGGMSPEIANGLLLILRETISLSFRGRASGETFGAFVKAAPFA